MYFFFQMIEIDSEVCIVGSLVTGLIRWHVARIIWEQEENNSQQKFASCSSLWLPTAELMSFRLDIFIKF